MYAKDYGTLLPYQ